MATPRNRRPESGPADLTGMLLRNVPPHNLDAEQAVLGGVLIKPSILDKLGIELRRVDFYDPRHQMIWEAMVGLWRENKPVDLITLAAALTAAGQLEKAGGPAYLGELAGCILSAANTLHHAGIMRAMSKRRSMAVIAILAEMRKQLELDNTIKRTKFDIERCMQFQAKVMEVLQRAAPDLARQVVEELLAIDATQNVLDFGLKASD